VLDEFPYLVRQASELPSVIQRQFDPASRRSAGQVRLLLCGSAMSLMGRLLSGGAPLRGRAALELVVPTFDFRLAARFWGISDPRTAVLTNAIVGGTPAYRREFTQGDAPAGPHDFDSWVVRTVLNPARPLFREARYLLAEEPGLRDTAVYNAVLAAIADGNSTRGGIASYMARPATDLAHPLAVLSDAGLIWREDDLFRANRSKYRIAEPMIGFYHAVMRPFWGDLERPGRAGDVWHRARQAFASKVIGPHFERLCRDWSRWYASAETFGRLPVQGRQRRDQRSSKPCDVRGRRRRAWPGRSRIVRDPLPWRGEVEHDDDPRPRRTPGATQGTAASSLRSQGNRPHSAGALLRSRVL
jgi:uncharacterized protein